MFTTPLSKKDIEKLCLPCVFADHFTIDKPVSATFFIIFCREMNSFKEKVEFWDALIGFCGWARLLNKAFQEQPPDLLIERF